MLVHYPITHSVTPAAMEPHSAAPGGLSLHEGAEAGMAAENERYTPLTVQQNVPNIGEAQRAPKQRVDATLEQGEGRAPGWKWGWMRKNIPYAPVTQQHKQRPFGPLRAETPRNSGANQPGTGREQFPIFKEKKRRATVLAGAETVYYTAAAPATPTWGEPV